MERTITQEKRYGAMVWEHAEMDALRKTECLCRLCARLKPGEPDNCYTAESLFQICKTDSVTMSLTRCQAFIAK